MKPEQVIFEARARILWGESASSVREWLISNGLSGTEADGQITEFTAERVTELRRLGIKNMIIGVAIWAGGTLMVYPCFRYFDSLSHIRRPVFIVLFGLVGLILGPVIVTLSIAVLRTYHAEVARRRGLP